MKVSQCMSTDVRLCSPQDTIRNVARTMKQADVGALPVGENDRLVGMITDRDIAIRAVAQGLSPDAKVGDVMSPDIQYCFEDDSIDDVSAQMADLQVRRLPVLNQAKRLVGMIALADIAQAEGPSSEHIAEAVCGISQPGGQHRQ